MPPLTATRARSLLAYSPITGALTWRVARGNRRAGDPVVAGVCPWLQVMIDKRNYRAHRVIWLIVKGVWPKDEIDHRDRNQVNNKWTNLREATSAQNKMNRQMRGPDKGVYIDKRDGTYYSRISIDGTLVHLGRFSSAEGARAARRRAERDHYGDCSCQTH